jgi:sugar transferase EpsL
MNYKKRIFDLALCFPAFIFCLPLMLVIGALVKIKMGPPIFFKQKRPGLHGRPFTLYKFRTMTEQKDASCRPLIDSERLTPFGEVLRKTSMDELPELFNVLKGDMSLVGPRPLLIKYLNRYTPEQSRRHNVKPGLTGWSQIHGRNAISWDEKLKYDTWYVDNYSLLLDVKISLITLSKIVKREGITQHGHATTEEFNPQVTQVKGISNCGSGN